MPENDPRLWTQQGIEAALDEMSGEKGASFEWGYKCVGAIPVSPTRSLDASMPVPSVTENPGLVELWVTVRVDEPDVLAYLHADACRSLKPGERFEIRKRHPDNYGRTFGMAWFRNDAMQTRKPWGSIPRPYARMSGYMLVGEYTVPGVPHERRAPPQEREPAPPSGAEEAS